MLIFNNKKRIEPIVNNAIETVIKNAVLAVLGTHKVNISPLENSKQQDFVDREQQAA